jgi:hypothetical protein
MRAAAVGISPVLPALWRTGSPEPVMKRTLGILALGLVAGTAVLAYNLWAYCCGRCTLRGFLVMGPYQKTMILLTCSVALLLVVVKLIGRRKLAVRRCSCGAALADDYVFCPECGASRRSP